MHPYIHFNTLITFYPFLYLYLNFICIEEELKSVRGFRFCYKVGGVYSAFDLFYLSNLSSLVSLA
jgi:hypothetical protein